MVIVFAVAIIGFGLFLMIIYNSLVSRKNEVKNSLRGIDVMLKNRFDLVPNLVATVKQYAKHEVETLSDVTKLRAMQESARGSVAKMQAADVATMKTLGSLIAVSEAYPDLKANESFIQLQRTLNELESQIAASRRSYNAAVTLYNNSVMHFPSNLIARTFGFGQADLYEVAAAERQPVNVGKIFQP